MKDTNLKPLMALLLTGVLMGALDLAIIGPALPAIQAEFSMGSRGLAWLFSIYVLGQLVGTPLLAKMSDRLGPRPIYIASIALFGDKASRNDGFEGLGRPRHWVKVAF